MIEAVELTKKFGDFVAVKEININVPEGEVLAFLGPNSRLRPSRPGRGARAPIG